MEDGRFRFLSPGLIIVAGSSMAGKTTFIKKLLQTPTLFHPSFDAILFCYGVRTESHEFFSQMPNVQMHEGLPDTSTLNIFAEANPGLNLLCVLDDLLQECLDNAKLITSLSTRLVHHLKMTTILVTQSIYALPKIIRSNCHYYVLVRSDADYQSIQMLGRQLFSGKNYKFFTSAHQIATEENYGYLIVTLHPRSYSQHKLVTDIFSPYIRVFRPKIDDKKEK
jgi:hypothetical protein